MSKVNSELKDSTNETDANTQSELDLFMIKHLKKKWPKRGVRICGVLQIIFSLAIAGLEVPIMMNSAPRWETFGGFWTGLIGFIAAITTLVTGLLLVISFELSIPFVFQRRNRLGPN